MTKLKILIADDSSVILSRLKNTMEENPKVNLIGEANNAGEISNFLKFVMPDVISLDIMMPGKSGIEVLMEIKKDYPSVKVIMLTNQSESYYRKLCMSLGADYFFDKSTEFTKVPVALNQIYDQCFNENNTPAA